LAKDAHNGGPGKGVRKEEESMRILVALDTNRYSQYVVNEVAKLAMNTWADVTLLGVESKKPPSNGTQPPRNLPIVRKLQEFREEFLGYFKDESVSPYAIKRWGYELVDRGKGLLEEMCVCKGMKDFRVRIRFGQPTKQILTEAVEEQSDLIVVGCSKGEQCTWEQDRNAPEKIVKAAPCSVLVVKEEKKPTKIVCCLDHDSVSQESLELINQMVTLHQTDLALVGLTESEHLREEVDQKMKQILQYYTAQKIKAWVSVVDVSLLDKFIADTAEKGLIALWMGHKSLIGKFFSQDRVGKLVRSAQSSVLILR